MADQSSRDGMGYHTSAILQWTAAQHAPHDAGLVRAFEAPSREEMPAIQIGPNEGRTLELLLRLAGARKVVEIGTLAGYSAIWMARALPPGGHLWTFEREAHHAAVARANFEAAGVAERVTILVGDALERLAEIEPEGPFCAVFVDADKGNYDRYGRWAAEHVRSGGLLLGDNAFFFGRLLEEGDAEAAAMRRFHEESRAAFDTVCLPTPDGLLLGVHR
ncbi:MAG: O-methyltransferase [Myxococcales bacterium]|nr:O-methyltransferase [Myxococcales bacterium]